MKKYIDDVKKSKQISVKLYKKVEEQSMKFKQ